uniref:IST1 homolog n=1 Tax=Syphacia muris TaxID=451379 RepID=A0A0N5AFL2_9BILA
MSISFGTQYAKLKTNLRLAINRLKLVEKKKTEQALKGRTEIAEFISAHKEDRARIRVEHIIREDFLVEAYELLEMYCDLLLARFGLIQQMKQLDDGIAEAVISVLWAAPRVSTDISELKVISDQLTVKYGKPFAEAARANQLEYPAKVSPKLISKLSVHTPPKLLVERYMIEIAKSAGIPFTPDPNVMREDEVAAAEQMLIDFKKQGGGGGFGWMYNNDRQPGGDTKNGPPPPPPSSGGSSGYYPGPPPPPPPPIGFGGAFNNGSGGFPTPIGSVPSAPNTGIGGGGIPAGYNYPRLNQPGIPGDEAPKVKPSDSIPTAPPASSPPKDTMKDIPQFPEPPSDIPDAFNDTSSSPSAPGGPSDGMDFDDLAKRFDELKKRKN